MLEVWIWLAEGLGYAAGNAGLVLENYPGGAPQIYDEREGIPLNGLFTPRQVERLTSTTPQDYLPLLQRSEAQGIQVIPFLGDKYPALLRNIYNPPPVLYVKGDAALLNGYLYIGMVGARKPSAYGVQAIKAIGEELARAGAVIVSGLAAGLDAEAHKAALAANAPTIACVATGLDRCYPVAHKTLMEVITRNGAVVSEYPIDTVVEKPYFLQRNRIIAGLSQGLVVAEARHRSGTMSTVNFAHDWGRDVFAVPGSIFSELSGGTHDMLREGACLAGSAEDILEIYAGEREVPATRRKERRIRKTTAETQTAAAVASPKDAPQEPDGDEMMPTRPLEEALAQVSEEARRAFAQLGAKPVSLAYICEGGGLAPGAAMAALTELELAGLSRQLAGRQFTINQ